MNHSEAALAAVILAGHSPAEEDLLAEHSLGRPKGLIPIAGRPMIAYVAEALAGSRHIRRIVVAGLPAEYHAVLPVAADYTPPQADMMGNAEAGIRRAMELLPGLSGVVIDSADLPLLTSEVADMFIAECLKTDHDLYYGVIERSVMEGRFPTSRRTYVHLADGEFAGGDLILVRPGALRTDQDLWRRRSSARKSPLHQAQMLGGLWPVVRLLTRRMSLSEAEQRASRALNLRGRVVVCPHAELGMDVDKPFQLEIVRAELEARDGLLSS